MKSYRIQIIPRPYNGLLLYVADRCHTVPEHNTRMLLLAVANRQQSAVITVRFLVRDGASNTAMSRTTWKR